MTVCSLDPPIVEQGILLRELNHRINSGLASAINLVSAAVVLAEGSEAKRALSDMVELLHGYADVQQALATPRGKALIDAATYVRMMGSAMRRSFLDRMNIRLALTTKLSAPTRAMPAARIDRPRAYNRRREACVLRGADRRNHGQADTGRHGGELRRPGQWDTAGTGCRGARDSGSLIILPRSRRPGRARLRHRLHISPSCRFRRQSVSAGEQGDGEASHDTFTPPGQGQPIRCLGALDRSELPGSGQPPVRTRPVSQSGSRSATGLCPSSGGCAGRVVGTRQPMDLPEASLCQPN